MQPKLVIVEGAQGVGKTKLTNSLREAIKYTQLLRLSGNGESSKKGINKSIDAHESCLKFIYDTGHCGLNYVLDRSYLSELVYSMYNGDHSLQHRDTLDRMLNRISGTYDITLVLLRASEEVIAERLGRDKPDYNDKVKFSAENSMKQQSKYLELGADLAKRCSLKLCVIDTSHLTHDEVLNLVMAELN